MKHKIPFAGKEKWGTPDPLEKITDAERLPYISEHLNRKESRPETVARADAALDRALGLK